VKLREQSATSKPLDDAVIFLDRSFGRKKLALELRQAGFNVKIHDEHFKQDENDDVWLKACGERGWWVITPDKRICHKYRHVIRESRTAVFIVSGNNIKAEQWADPIITNATRILRIVKKTAPPFIARITRTDVKMVDDCKAAIIRRKPMGESRPILRKHERSNIS
jgi:hypothetical protein